LIGRDRQGTPRSVHRRSCRSPWLSALVAGLTWSTAASAAPAIGPAPPAATGDDADDDSHADDDGDDDGSDDGSDDGAAPTQPARRDAFAVPPAHRDDPYGPRSRSVTTLTREQVVRFALDNPAVSAAEQKVEAMQAQLQKAKFLWVPGVDTLTTLSPGVNVRCDDVMLDNGTTEAFEFQFCRASDDPNLDVNTVRGYFSQLSSAGVRVAFRADSLIPLFTFGKIKQTKELAKAGVALRKLEKAATEAETILLVERAYVGLIAAREGQAILREAKKVLDRARSRVDKDLGPEDDWDDDGDESAESERDPNDRIKVKLAQIELQQKMREALKIESVALAALWALAGKAAPPGFDVRATGLAADEVDGGLDPLRDYQELAATSRPEAKMAAAGIRARAAQQRLARANFLPDFGIALRVDVARSSSADQQMSQLYYQDAFNYSRFTAALAMSWRWNLGMVFDLRKARAELRAAEYTQEAARLLLGQEVATAYADLVEARYRITDADEATALSWKLVVSLEIRDSVGGGDSEKLLRALEGWYKKRFEAVEAVHQHNEALARLARAVGTPLVRHAPTAGTARRNSTPAPASEGSP
jgi:outer membrane protein TolC